MRGRALLHKQKAVSHFPERGGDADVEETTVHGTAVPGVSGGNAVHTDHKGVLAARVAPNG